MGKKNNKKSYFDLYRNSEDFIVTWDKNSEKLTQMTNLAEYPAFNFNL